MTEERVDFQREAIRRAVRSYYDVQKPRIATGQRAGIVKDPDKKKEPKPGTPEPQLGHKQITELTAVYKDLVSAEKKLERFLRRSLEGYPIYDEWLLDQKGVGPLMAAILISEFDPYRAKTVSSFWKRAGLDVVDGKAPRKQKGVKATYNPWLRAKLVGVLAESFIKLKSSWRDLYDNYKHRKETQLLDVCMGCKGTGKVSLAEKRESYSTEKKKKESHKCSNCEGTGGPAPWGNSKAHRHAAAKRYMIKIFLLEFFNEWRQLEGLEVREPYYVEKLGMERHSA